MVSFGTRTGKRLGYGLLLFIAFNVVLFVATLATGIESTEITANSTRFVVSLAAAAILMFLVARWFGRLLRFDTRRDAQHAGIWWTAIVVTLTLLTTIPNGTTRIFFGTWAAYLIFIAIYFGAVTDTPKRSTRLLP